MSGLKAEYCMLIKDILKENESFKTTKEILDRLNRKK